MGIDFTPNLLIVDDREENLELLRVVLGKINVELELVQSPIKALQDIEKKEYALIILDIQMPQMDGFLLAQKIRSGHVNKSTPIIFLTAFFLDKESELKGYQCGCVDFIMKPFDSKVLINKVNIFLDLYRSRHLLKTNNEKLKQALEQKDLLQGRLRNLVSNYRTILESQNELIFKMNCDFQIEFANKAFSDFFDYNFDGVLLNSISEVNMNFASVLKRKIDKMNGKSQSIVFNKTIWNSASQQKSIEWSVSKEVSFDEVHYVVVGRDISDKKRLKKSLLKKEKFLSKLQKNASVAVWEWDSYSQIARGSEEFYRLYEIKPTVSDNLLERIRSKTHQDDLDVIEQIFSHLPKKNQKLMFEHRIISDNKNVKYIKVVFYTEYNKNDDVLSIYGISSDISREKVLEKTIKSTSSYEGERFVNKTFFELDEDNKIQFLNEFGLDFLECEDLKKPKTISFLDFFSKEDADKVEKALELTKEKQSFIFEEFTIVTCKKNVKKVVLSAYPIELENFAYGIRGLFFDLTETSGIGEQKENTDYRQIINGLKSQEKEFKENTSELKKRVKKELEVSEFQRQLLLKKSELETLGKMASSMVNEINQPLTGISMVMDNIVSRLSTNTIDEEYMKNKCTQIFHEIDRIKKYLSQVGIFNSYQKENNSDSVNLKTVIKDAVSLIKKQYKNSPVQVDFAFESGTFFVCGDKYKLQKVIIDLLNNSYESIHEKLRKEKLSDKEARIKIKLETSEADVFICIEDNGVGIDEKDLNYVFEPFFTTKQKEISSGLGLYTSKNVIQKMKGEIVVTSEKNQFTQIKITLPYERKKQLNLEHTLTPLP